VASAARNRSGPVSGEVAADLGAIKTAGALGLLVGFAAPLLGTAAAVGLVLFFICALVVQLRVRYYKLAIWAVFFVLAVSALTVNLACHSPIT